MRDAAVNRSACLRTLLFMLVYLGCELLGIALAFGVWLSSRGDTFLARNFRLQCWWATTLRRAAFAIFSMRLEVTGREHTTPGPLLMFVRHCSVADTMLPVMLVSAPHRIVLRWVMKQELLWDPCLDIVGNRLRNCFVSRTHEHQREDVAAVASLMDDLGPEDGAVIYPEGTRFSERKRQRLLDRAADRGDDALVATITSLRHVLPPRLGGALALLDNNPGADALFCAHTGLEGTATFWDLLAGGVVGRAVRISLWRVPHADIPGTSSARAVWLHEHWARIDAFVSEHVDAGKP
jgi:1-acyl-sn-glycerol-3-phosphate acyltransferase